MTAHDLVVYLQNQGFILLAAPGGRLGSQAEDKLTDGLRETIRSRKTELLAVLTRPVAQPDLFPTRRALPPVPPPSEDANYHTQRCRAVLEQWRQRDWGPCQRCG